jgi:hypothetical protein
MGGMRAPSRDIPENCRSQGSRPTTRAGPQRRPPPYRLSRATASSHSSTHGSRLGLRSGRRRRRGIRADCRGRRRRSVARYFAQPDRCSQRERPERNGCCDPARRIRSRLSIHRRSSGDPRSLLPRLARPLLVLERARLELLAPYYSRDEAALAVCLATAPTAASHCAGRCSISLAPSAIRKRKHLCCPGTRARTTGTRLVEETALRRPTRCHLARPKGFSATSRPLPDARGRLQFSPSLPSPARPLVLPGGESAQRLSLADRGYEPHLPLTPQGRIPSGDIPECWRSERSCR